MCRAVRVICLVRRENQSENGLYQPVERHSVLISLFYSAIPTLEWHIIWFLGFSSGKREIHIHTLSGGGWDWACVSCLLEESHPLLYHLLLDTPLQVLPGFITAFQKWNVYFRSFSHWMFSHWLKYTLFSSVIPVRAVSFQLKQNRLFVHLSEQMVPLVLFPNSPSYTHPRSQKKPLWNVYD